MRNTLSAVVVSTFVTMSAGAFVGDAVQKYIGELGPALVKAVRDTGEVLTEIARPSADDLIKNRIQIQKRLRDLKGDTEAISQLIDKMQESRALLSMEKLGGTKRANLLQLVPADLRSDVEKKNAIDMKALQVIYAPIKADVQRDLLSFETALSEIEKSSDMDAVNRVGRTRGALVASSSRLTELSGLLEVLAHVQ